MVLPKKSEIMITIRNSDAEIATTLALIKAFTSLCLRRNTHD